MPPLKSHRHVAPLLRSVQRPAIPTSCLRLLEPGSLPDHLHAIWTLPPDDAAFAKRWGLIKAAFSRNLPRIEWRSDSRKQKGERGIWQRRYWEHMIRNDEDYARHVDYIHVNPVKHGHAMHPLEWPYSSIHRYVKDGILPSDWSGPAKMEERQMLGEA